MKRRTFLSAATASVVGAGVAANAGFDAGAATSTGRNREVSELLLDSTCSFVSTDGEPLTDDSVIAVWASDSAYNVDEDGNGDAVSYPDDVPIPAIVDQGPVFASGSVLVHDGTEYPGDNANFLLNVFDEKVDGSTVLWDESHGQFYTLEDQGEGTAEGFSAFASQAADAGYDLQATTNFESDLPDADAVVITTPAQGLSDSELTALSEFAEGGGAVVLLGQSDFNDFDETANYNAIMSELGVDARFNDDQVLDDDSNGGQNFLPVTGQFNRSFPYFGDGGGTGTPGDPEIDFQAGEQYQAVVSTVDDGDTLTARFSDGGVAPIRLLGVDTPETPSAAEFERPEEWEGLGDESDPTSGLGGNGLSEVQFGSTCSLLDPEGELLSDGETIAVWAEPTATNADADGDGDAVSYPPTHPIPLAAVDDTVVGFGSALVADGYPTEFDNDELVLNAWDALLEGSGTVLWEEGHDQTVTRDAASGFVEYAESQGYDVQSTSALTDNLGSADAAVVHAPGRAYTDEELGRLREFVRDGGAVFLHDRNDFDGLDGTGYLNEVAERLDLSFRFNDDQVIDETNNTGQPFRPTTSNFNYAAPFFDGRPGVDGAPSDSQDLGEHPYLAAWALKASTYTDVAVGGETITVSFDENEPVRDGNGRLLAYVDFDADGSGTRDTSLNGTLLDHGLARVYHSSLGRHEEFWQREAAARAESRGLWAGSDTGNTEPIRNRTVDDVFVPNAVPITSADGEVPERQVPVFAESSADPGEAPLVGVDNPNRLALLGGSMVDDRYEQAEGFPVDTAGLENYTFLLNVIVGLASRGGSVLVDGGHGQFGVDYGISAEETAFFQRYLEGFDVGLEGVNGNYEQRLRNARALIVSAPARDVSEETLRAWRRFARNDGAVILVGNALAPAESRTRLNGVAEALGSNLRFGEGRVVDAERNVNDDERLPVTTNFNEGPSPALFTPYEDQKSIQLRTTPQTTTQPSDDDEATATPAPTTAPSGTTVTTGDGGGGDGGGAPGPGLLGTAAGVLGGLELARRRRRSDDDEA